MKYEWRDTSTSSYTRTFTACLGTTIFCQSNGDRHSRTVTKHRSGNCVLIALLGHVGRNRGRALLIETSELL
jgi:hypothetical protein